jgi:hypothetical protein
MWLPANISKQLSIEKDIMQWSITIAKNYIRLLWQGG